MIYKSIENLHLSESALVATSECVRPSSFVSNSKQAFAFVAMGLARLLMRSKCSFSTIVSSLAYFVIVLFLQVPFSTSVFAADEVPIIIDFENSTDNSKWVLNNGDKNVVAQLKNRWCFSSADHFMGRSALTISNKYSDSNPTPTYVNTGSDVSVVAYTEITLPRGVYDLSFAWKCLGESGVDGFYVIWESPNVKMSSSLGGISQDLVTRAISFSGGRKHLSNVTTWQTETVTIKSDGLKRRLAFVWTNNGANASAYSASIDFIQIAKHEVCTAISNIDVHSTIDANRSSVTWAGVADEYEVMSRLQGDTSEVLYKGNITSHSASIEASAGKYGLYDFFVRGICGNDTSIWYPYCNHLIYAPGCIDFVNLENTNVKCEYNFRDSKVEEGRGGASFKPIDQSDWKRGIVDYGPESMMSRHTVNTMRDMDPRTGYKLPTIPDDEVVSVRLGNWNIGAEGERITYSVVADSLYPIILLKYAVVFQDPDHDRANQPRFTMKVMDDRYATLEFGCGDEDFRPGVDLKDDGWHEFSPNTTDEAGRPADIIRWKEWTTVGVRIPQHLYGKKIHIMLQTYDCEEGGHFGYAYFTLSCVSASITGIVCGKQEKLELKGPNGFTYEWYDTNPMDPSSTHKVLHREQNFPVDGTIPKTYYCLCNFKTDNQSKLKNCGFLLKANTTPRFPLASAKFQPEPANCTDNYVKFNNVSAVVDEKGVSMGGLRCDSYEWHISGNGLDSVLIDKSPKIKFPQKGGVYNVTLKAFMSEGGCQDDTVFTLNVPALETKYTTVDTTVCKSRVFRWNGKIYRDSAKDTASFQMSGGCDSIVYLNLNMVDVISDTVIDTICQGIAYSFGGQNYTTSGEYHYIKPPKSKTDCESHHYLLLTVLDSLGVTFGAVPEICSGDSLFVLPLEVKQGGYLSVLLDFDSLAESAGFVDTTLDASNSDLNIVLPHQVRPDYYNVTLRFAVENCDTAIRKFSFEIRYPVDIIKQKWNDVIAVLDSAYNGGYQFDGYRWYKDGVLMHGFNNSYMYLGTKKFDYDKRVEYNVELRRKGEKKFIRSCALVPEQHNDISEYITLSVASVGQRIALSNIESNAIARWWSISGQLINEERVSSDEPYITAPTNSGAYLVELLFDNFTGSNIDADILERRIFKIYIK